MLKLKNPYPQWSIGFILLGVLIRLIHIDQPILEGAATRQIQTAVVTYNLLINGFDFLYPQTNLLPEPRYFILEPPIYNFVVALLYKIFGVHEYLGRLVSVSAFVGTAFYLYKIAAKNLNESIGRAAVFFFTFSPLSILFTRAFQPDPTALFFSVGLVFYFVEWIRGSDKAYWTACAFGAVAFFVKQTFLFIMLPLVVYGVARKGMGFFRDKKTFLFFIILLPAPILWSLHAKQVAQAFPVNHFVANFRFSNWFNPQTLLTYVFYKNIFQWLSGLILTPFGFVLLFLGLFIKTDKQSDMLLNIWLTGVAIFYLIFSNHAHTHEYYHLPLLPVAALVIGKAWWFLFENDRSPARDLWLNPFFRMMSAAIVAVMVFGYSNSAFKLPDQFRHFSEEIEILNKYTQDENLIVVTEGHHLYYGHNLGWAFLYDAPGVLKRKTFADFLPTDREPVVADILEGMRKSGAQYFFVTQPDRFYKNQEFSDYVLAHYPVVAQKDGVCILFDLKKRNPETIPSILFENSESHEP